MDEQNNIIQNDAGILDKQRTQSVGGNEFNFSNPK